jgi:hypothetical protein
MMRFQPKIGVEFTEFTDLAAALQIPRVFSIEGVGAVLESCVGSIEKKKLRVMSNE